MSTKGTWQRPGDRRAFDDNYARIFREKERTMPRNKPRPISQIRAELKKAHAILDRIVICDIGGSEYERMEGLRMELAGTLSQIKSNAAYGLDCLGASEGDDD